jgi:citrate lyase beta subunit
MPAHRERAGHLTVGHARIVLAPHMWSSAMKTTLSLHDIRPVVDRVCSHEATVLKRYPGETTTRQPVHVVYGGAHLFKANTPQKLGALALAALHKYAPDCLAFGRAMGLPGWELFPTEPSAARSVVEQIANRPDVVREQHSDVWKAHEVHRRVVEKLTRDPVEDYRIDFEDGYGTRPDAEEDHHAESAARELALGFSLGTLPAFVGLRIKPLNSESAERSIRTLDIFFSSLMAHSGRNLPPSLLVTLPKIQWADQVTALADVLDSLEEKAGVPRGFFKVELMVETPQCLVDPGGKLALPELLDAARGRAAAAHFGTYDYSASHGIVAASQHMRHPACNFAKHMMQVAFAGTGIRLSDGATNVLPVPPHKAVSSALLPLQMEENQRAVHAAWRQHFGDVQHSLEGGFYQGWDLHPAQLCSRYAAVFTFFRSHLSSASERLRLFVARAAQATVTGTTFDDAASGQGLLNFFLRGMGCGALNEEDALQTGLSLHELGERSFARIVANRRVA